MKKIIVFLIIIVIGCIGGEWIYYQYYNKSISLPNFINIHTNKKYIIKKGKNVVDSVSTKEEAIKRAKTVERAVVVNTYNDEWIYSKLKPFIIETENSIYDFETFEEAFKYAKHYECSAIYYKNDTNTIWEDKLTVDSMKCLKVSLINQLPELPRGCEVTALNMLLNYRGVNVSKMKLAEEVKKDTTQYKKDEKGRIYYGNPYDGFVGNMYNIKKQGYGVYHGPIVELAKKYVGEKVIDLTDMEFQDVLVFLSKGNPVWAITNVTYKPLEESDFTLWHTPTGIVKVTNKQHAVVLTGFDQEYVYINDPLSRQSNIRLERENFKKAWEQMGNQAVTIIK